MQPLDVSALQAQLDFILVDLVKITKPGEETFDYETGETQPGLPVTVYEGRGALVPEGEETPGMPYPTVPNPTDGAYRLILPVEVENIEPGLDVRITGSKILKYRDPEILERVFKTKTLAPVTSFPVFKILSIEEVK